MVPFNCSSLLKATMPFIDIVSDKEAREIEERWENAAQSILGALQSVQNTIAKTAASLSDKVVTTYTNLSDQAATAYNTTFTTLSDQAVAAAKYFTKRNMTRAEYLQEANDLLNQSHVDQEFKDIGNFLKNMFTSEENKGWHKGEEFSEVLVAQTWAKLGKDISDYLERPDQIAQAKEEMRLRGERIKKEREKIFEGEEINKKLEEHIMPLIDLVKTDLTEVREELKKEVGAVLTEEDKTHNSFKIDRYVELLLQEKQDPKIASLQMLFNVLYEKLHANELEAFIKKHEEVENLKKERDKIFSKDISENINVNDLVAMLKEESLGAVNPSIFETLEDVHFEEALAKIILNKSPRETLSSEDEQGIQKYKEILLQEIQAREELKDQYSNTISPLFGYINYAHIKEAHFLTNLIPAALVERVENFGIDMIVNQLFQPLNYNAENLAHHDYNSYLLSLLAATTFFKAEHSLKEELIKKNPLLSDLATGISKDLSTLILTHSIPLKDQFIKDVESAKVGSDILTTPLMSIFSKAVENNPKVDKERLASMPDKILILMQESVEALQKINPESQNKNYQENRILEKLFKDALKDVWGIEEEKDINPIMEAFKKELHIAQQPSIKDQFIENVHSTKAASDILETALMRIFLSTIEHNKAGDKDLLAVMTGKILKSTQESVNKFNNIDPKDEEKDQKEDRIIEELFENILKDVWGIDKEEKAMNPIMKLVKNQLHLAQRVKKNVITPRQEALAEARKDLSAFGMHKADKAEKIGQTYAEGLTRHISKWAISLALNLLEKQENISFFNIPGQIKADMKEFIINFAHTTIMQNLELLSPNVKAFVESNLNEKNLQELIEGFIPILRENRELLETLLQQELLIRLSDFHKASVNWLNNLSFKDVVTFSEALVGKVLADISFLLVDVGRTFLYGVEEEQEELQAM